jgi:hypothetical protein
LKNLQAPYFSDFRRFFRASLEKIFVVPADTFVNVKGKFPIGFMIWDTDKKEIFNNILADVYDKDGNFDGQKTFISYEGMPFLNDWLRPYWGNTYSLIGYMACNGNDFQHQNEVAIISKKSNETSTFFKPITRDNFIMSCIYFAVRKVIPADWLNDRDQFLFPNDDWKTDTEFQSDCLAYTLFNNNIQSAYGTNNWIPFTEKDVDARDKFASNFMTDFIAGKLAAEEKSTKGVQTTIEFSPPATSALENSTKPKPAKLEFSPVATAVFDAGRKLWRYYHKQTGGESNVNVSLYDIREHFQGRNDKGKMNNKSTDEKYNALIGNLRDALKTLACKIEPKVYEYGFLKE